MDTDENSYLRRLQQALICVYLCLSVVLHFRRP
jgi:hypothetical protein